MLMRRWTPPSQVPRASMDYNTTSQRQRTLLRWCKVIIYLVAVIILCSYCTIYILQNERFFKEKYQHRQQDRNNQQEQLLFDTYIQDISSHLLKISDKNSINENFLLYIRTQTLRILRKIDIKQKKDIILFLYEVDLIQNNQLNLRGADLNNVQLTCPYDLHHLHLPGVLWSNAIFINCHLMYATFDQAYLVNARFINSSLQYASLMETKLDNSHFIQTTIMNTNFNGASLIQTNFLQAGIVQENNFTNADLYQAQLTNDQLEGKNSVIKHDFSYARFPNGSFGLFNSQENLIRNGNAETECFAKNQTLWTTSKQNMTLSTDTIENLIMNESYWGNCSFVISTPTRVYQNIDLHSYKLLIDTHNAVISFLAFASCTETYFEINMFRADKVLHESKNYSKRIDEIESYDNKTMYPYGDYQYYLPKYTRHITVAFGVEIFQSLNRCYFDNITLTISQSKIK